MALRKKHIVIDGRIRRASTGRPIARLLEHLQEIDTDHHYSVLVEPNDPWKPTNRNFVAVPCKYKQFSFNPLQQITFAWQLYRLKPDLVHFTLTPQQPVFYFGRQITLTHDLTMLKFARPGRFPKWVHSLRMKGYRFLLWQSHKKAVKVITPTEYVMDAVNKYHLFTNRKTIVTYEASEPPLTIPAQAPEQAPEHFIMHVGSPFPHKNIERLILAFELLKESHQDLKLVLIGKREFYFKQLERWAKKQRFYEDIIFTGFVPDEELKWYYENTQAYVLPSLSEGFGLPGLEAMAHGCPVVSSNVTCLPEVNGDAAHYFDPEDVQDMVQKIDEVMTNTRLRNNLILKGHENLKRFSWRKMARETLLVYRDVLKEN